MGSLSSMKVLRRSTILDSSRGRSVSRMTGPLFLWDLWERWLEAGEEERSDSETLVSWKDWKFCCCGFGGGGGPGCGIQPGGGGGGCWGWGIQPGGGGGTNPGGGLNPGGGIGGGPGPLNVVRRSSCSETTLPPSERPPDISASGQGVSKVSRWRLVE